MYHSTIQPLFERELLNGLAFQFIQTVCIFRELVVPCHYLAAASQRGRCANVCCYAA